MSFGVLSYKFGKIKILIYKILNYNRIYFGKNIKCNLSTRFYLEKNSKIIIGNNFRTRNNVSIYGCNSSQIKISDNVFFNDNCMISCRNKIVIGKNTIFGNNVSIYDNDHDYKNSLQNYVSKKITIGNNVWCGCNVVILKGVTIGDNSIIAAGTIVNKNIPNNCIVYQSKSLIVRKVSKND